MLTANLIYIQDLHQNANFANLIYIQDLHQNANFANLIYIQNLHQNANFANQIYIQDLHQMLTSQISYNAGPASNANLIYTGPASKC